MKFVGSRKLDGLLFLDTPSLRTVVLSSSCIEIVFVKSQVKSSLSLILAVCLIEHVLLPLSKKARQLPSLSVLQLYASLGRSMRVYDRITDQRTPNAEEHSAEWRLCRMLHPFREARDPGTGRYRAADWETLSLCHIIFTWVKPVHGLSFGVLLGFERLYHVNSRFGSLFWSFVISLRYAFQEANIE